MTKYVIGREPDAVKTRMRVDLVAVGRHGDKEVITKVANAANIGAYYWLAQGASEIGLHNEEGASAERRSRARKRMVLNQTIVHDLYEAALERDNLPKYAHSYKYAHS